MNAFLLLTQWQLQLSVFTINAVKSCHVLQLSSIISSTCVIYPVFTKVFFLQLRTRFKPSPNLSVCGETSACVSLVIDSLTRLTKNLLKIPLLEALLSNTLKTLKRRHSETQFCSVTTCNLTQLTKRRKIPVSMRILVAGSLSNKRWNVCSKTMALKINQWTLCSLMTLLIMSQKFTEFWDSHVVAVC